MYFGRPGISQKVHRLLSAPTAGYVDDALFGVSTYTMIRTRDLAAVTGPAMRQWIRENSIELISYRDLISQEGEH